MKTNIVVGARFHSVMLADVLSELGEDFEIYSSAPPGHFKGKKKYPTHFVPLLAAIASRLSPFSFSKFELWENRVFDLLCEWRMRPADVLYGWAGYSLESGRAVKEEGGLYVLERSCPHIFFQEDLLKEEAQKYRVAYKPKPTWWVERSLTEYAEADVIVVPSQYSRKTFLSRGFPEEKVFLAVLDKPVRIRPRKFKVRDSFVVGCLGGNTLRKGFLYLLEAWDKLKLKNAKLILKADEKELRSSPVLNRLIKAHPNIQIVKYFPNISQFYDECDLFVLPSVDDGFGLAMTEALAHGLPSVVTKNVGASELFQDQGVAFTVAPRNSDALAEKILYCFENRGEALEMGRKGQELVSLLNQQGTRYQAAVTKLYTEVLPGLLNRPKLELGVPCDVS